MMMINRRWMAMMMLGALLLAFYGGTKYEAWREAERVIEVVDTLEPIENDLPDEEEESPGIFVHVTGAVEHSGVFELKAGQRVEDALAMAGLKSDAAADALNRAALLSDGQKIVVPSVAEQTSQTMEATGMAMPTDDRISINQADRTTLMQLPGIGEVKAQAIIDYRTVHGGFQSLEELKNVKGIGEKTYEGLAADIIL